MRTAPIAWILFFSKPLSFLSKPGLGGIHGFTGWGQPSGPVIPSPNAYIWPPGLQCCPPDCSYRRGGRVLGCGSPQVTEQTVPTPPQPRGWRQTRFWFLRLLEHTGTRPTIGGSNDCYEVGGSKRRGAGDQWTSRVGVSPAASHRAQVSAPCTAATPPTTECGRRWRKWPDNTCRWGSQTWGG